MMLFTQFDMNTLTILIWAFQYLDGDVRSTFTLIFAFFWAKKKAKIKVNVCETLQILDSSINFFLNYINLTIIFIFPTKYLEIQFFFFTIWSRIFIFIYKHLPGMLRRLPTAPLEKCPDPSCILKNKYFFFFSARYIFKKEKAYSFGM